jgi:hypothetical protein
MIAPDGSVTVIGDCSLLSLSNSGVHYEGADYQSLLSPLVSDSFPLEAQSIVSGTIQASGVAPQGFLFT